MEDPYLKKSDFWFVWIWPKFFLMRAIKSISNLKIRGFERHFISICQRCLKINRKSSQYKISLKNNFDSFSNHDQWKFSQNKEFMNLSWILFKKKIGWFLALQVYQACPLAWIFPDISNLYERKSEGERIKNNLLWW